MPDVPNFPTPVKICLVGHDLENTVHNKVYKILNDANCYFVDEHANPDITIVLALKDCSEQIPRLKAMINGLEFGGYAIMYLASVLTSEELLVFSLTGLDQEHEAHRFVRAFNENNFTATLELVVDKLNADFE